METVVIVLGCDVVLTVLVVVVVVVAGVVLDGTPLSMSNELT